MFDALTDKLNAAFSKITSRGVLNEKDIDEAMRDIRVALLEADVSLPVVKDFIARVKAEALGEKVIKSVKPGQMVVKIVHDELVKLLGAEDCGLNFKAVPPVCILMVGLQGSGKTTTSGKIAKRLKDKNRKKVLLASLDIYRPAAQEQLAQRVLVTRQAVSRWETGETQPGTDTLKLLSQVFNVSVNTLLGAPRQLICQCCEMPLNEDSFLSREADGSFNEEYCKWCYSGGTFAYPSKASLLDYLVAHMPNPDRLDDETRRAQFDAYLSGLRHWR